MTDYSQMSDEDLHAIANGGGNVAPDAPDFSTMGDEDLQKLATSDQKTSVGSDIEKTLIGNVAPNAAANWAANLVSVPATVGSYALQVGTKGGEYLGEGVDETQRYLRGQSQKKQADYDQEQKDLMNAIRGKIGLSPTTSGDISGLVPTPSNLLNAGANAVGLPLYQPKTELGKNVATFGNVATAGLGSGVKALPALMGAAGTTGGGEAVKQLGGTQAEQFLGSLAGGIGGGAIGQTAAPETPMSNVEDSAVNTLGSKTEQPFTHTSDTLRSMAQDAYANSKSLGAEFSPEDSASLPQSIEQNLMKTGKLNDRLHGDTLSILNDMKNQAENDNMSLEDVHQYRQLFGDAINNNLHPNGKMKPDAMKANSAIDAIDDFLDNARQNPDKLVSGSPESIKAWQKGQDLWASSNRVNDIERIMQRAELMQNPATSMRQGFATLVSNPKRLRGFTPEQQELIKDASQTNLGGEALRAIGSRLLAIASFSHSPLAGLAAIPISAASRNLQTMQQAARGQNIIRNLTQDIPQEYTSLQASQKVAPLALPSPAVNVPAGGFGAVPEEPPVTTPRTQSSNALPAPREMQYDDMVKAGRILPSSQDTPINLPDKTVKTTYSPNDLNRGDEVGVPETKINLLGDKQPQILDTSPKAIESRLARKVNTNFSGAVDEYNKIPDTKGGKILNTDSARELSSDYGADRSLSHVVHEPASSFVKKLYAQKLKEEPKEGEEPMVLFTAGGTGSGKSTAVKNALGEKVNKAQIVYDTNMNKFDASKTKIEQALNAGKGVHIIYTYRDPVNALVNGALPRASRMENERGSGRTVPLQEHINTHIGSLSTIKRLAEHYENNPRVQITTIDNNGDRNSPSVIPLASVPKITHNGLKQRLTEVLDEEYNAGKISAKIYKGFSGKEPQNKTSDLRSENNDVLSGSGNTGISGKPQTQPSGERID